MKLVVVVHELTSSRVHKLGLESLMLVKIGIVYVQVSHSST